jgi:hypothetical protein
MESSASILSRFASVLREVDETRRLLPLGLVERAVDDDDGRFDARHLDVELIVAAAVNTADREREDDCREHLARVRQADTISADDVGRGAAPRVSPTR